MVKSVPAIVILWASALLLLHRSFVERTTAFQPHHHHHRHHHDEVGSTTRRRRRTSTVAAPRPSIGRSRRQSSFGIIASSPTRVSSTASSSSSSSDVDNVEAASSQQQQLPQVFASGHATNADLVLALEEAMTMALGALPADYPTKSIDVAMVFVSSLYDGGTHSPATVVVPTIQHVVDNAGWDIQNLIGCSVASCIGSSSSSPGSSASSCTPVEWEGIPAVSVMLGLLPDTRVRAFHVMNADVPDEVGRLPAETWKRAVGLEGVETRQTQQQQEDGTSSGGGGTGADDDAPLFWLMPSPAFATLLDSLLQGISVYFPGSQTVGGVASTVSSLSRAKLFIYNARSPSANTCHTDGCVGLVMDGDIMLRSLTARGAKPVGGIYQILKAQDSTIQAIVLDEVATEQLDDAEMEEDDDDDEEEEEEDQADMTDAQQRAQAYAKARIPKPVLAEANFLMRTLSDDDQAFMRRQLLVGLEQGGNVGRSASELARLAQGQGHRFTVHQVASGGMKDGSVTLPLGSVNIIPGTRLRFFVRDAEYAKKEIVSLWTGFKKRLLDDQFQQTPDTSSSSHLFTPTGCIVVPTMDRGSKFFLGKEAYESKTIASVLPGLPSIGGFFANGVIGPMDAGGAAGASTAALQGSASGYFLFGSKSGRPIYSAKEQKAAIEAEKEQKLAEEATARVLAAEDEKRRQRATVPTKQDSRSPRSEDGELILKRRDVHAGRALTVSTVEWSVAEKTAAPSSTLEDFMWQKETMVDRQKERVPLANLVSQCRLAAADPTSLKPRDFVGPLKQAVRAGSFVVVPECKRMEPTSGSLWRRYDVAKLAKELTVAGAAALSVNCDAVLFGGTLEDVTTARKAASAAAVDAMSGHDGVVAPPVLASDLILYPYQLYKIRLSGADAVNLMGGALASKDLLYLTKIASSLQLQTLVTVTSEVQLRRLTGLSAGSIHGVILSNRELEDFSFHMDGEQALHLLQSDALNEVREKHGDDLLVLVEGRVGIIERGAEASTQKYLQELKEAGASGAVVGGGLVNQDLDTAQTLKALQDA